MSTQDRLDALRSELADLEVVAELEAHLVDAKDAGDADEVARIKPLLREARRVQRENRAAAAVAAPDAVVATATVEDVT